MGMPCLKYEEHCALGKEMCQCFQGSDRKPGLEVRVSGFQPKAGSVQSRSLFGIISENLQKGHGDHLSLGFSDPFRREEVPGRAQGLRCVRTCPSQPLLLYPLCQAPSTSLACISDMCHGGLEPEVTFSLPERCLTAQGGLGDRTPRSVLCSGPLGPQNTC